MQGATSLSPQRVVCCGHGNCRMVSTWQGVKHNPRLETGWAPHIRTNERAHAPRALQGQRRPWQPTTVGPLVGARLECCCWGQEGPAGWSCWCRRRARCPGADRSTDGMRRAGVTRSRPCCGRHGPLPRPSGGHGMVRCAHGRHGGPPACRGWLQHGVRLQPGRCGVGWTAPCRPTAADGRYCVVAGDPASAMCGRGHA